MWIRDLITTYTNKQFLKKVLSGKIKLDSKQKEVLLERELPKNTNKTVRSLFAQLKKELRKEFPYKTGKFDKAKKKFEEYFTLENHIEKFENLKEGNYIVSFRDYYPVKGERYREYYLNYTSSKNDVFVITEKSEFGSWKLENYKRDYWADTIHSDKITRFLYATEEQIKQFKKAEKKYKSLEEKIQKKSDEIRELQRQQNNLNKNFLEFPKLDNE